MTHWLLSRFQFSRNTYRSFFASQLIVVNSCLTWERHQVLVQMRVNIPYVHTSAQIFKSLWHVHQLTSARRNICSKDTTLTCEQGRQWGFPEKQFYRFIDWSARLFHSPSQIQVFIVVTFSLKASMNQPGCCLLTFLPVQRKHFKALKSGSYAADGTSQTDWCRTRLEFFIPRFYRIVGSLQSLSFYI